MLLDLSSFESPKEGSDFCLTTLPTKALHLTGIGNTIHMYTRRVPGVR